MSKTVKSVLYTVWDSGTTRTGSADAILEQMRRNLAREDKEVEHMTMDDYADALIADAPYSLPKKILDSLESLDFPTKYDRSLAYLCATPTGRVRILSQKN